MGDLLNDARNYVECGALAVEGSELGTASSNAIRVVLDDAINRMRAIAKEIVETQPIRDDRQ